MRKNLLACWSVLGAFVCLMFAATAGHAGEDSSAALKTKLDYIQTLRGQFTQTLEDETGELLESSSGLFVMQKPGQFFWHTTAPFEQQLISDGATIWLYDPDLLQVTVRQVNSQEQSSPAHLLSASTQELASVYEVSEPEPGRFTLQPREPEALFETLTLVFRGSSIEMVILQDALGQISRIHLHETRLNQSVDGEIFNFTPPADVDVLID